MKNEDEIYELIDYACNYSGSKYPGMSYEEGISDALLWVLGEGPHPMEDEE